MKRIGTVALLSIFLGPGLGGAVAQDGYVQIKDRSVLVDRVVGHTVRRGDAVEVTLSEDGTLSGQANGDGFTGTWTWQGVHYCRDLVFATGATSTDCQTMELNGSKLRITPNKGAGDPRVYEIQ